MTTARMVIRTSGEGEPGRYVAEFEGVEGVRGFGDRRGEAALDCELAMAEARLVEIKKAEGEEE